MWHPRLPSRSSAGMLALQIGAERAGCALACPYSSSAEFEAAVIRSKLAAGIYGPRRRRRQMLYAGAAIGMLVVLVLMF
jgi:hypothetical protein